MESKPSKASILGALSQALDLVEGQPEGHALRSARIALRIATELGFDDNAKEDLYFAAVLKDSGCSNNSVRVHQIFGGDEHLAKQGVKLIDWTSPVESVKFSFQNTERGQSIGTKLRRMAMNLGTPKQVMNQVTEARCTRGAEIARMLSCRPEVADGIKHLDEHWNGNGAPYGKRGNEIPLIARIICLCQSFEVFMMSFGLDAAYNMIRDRSGRWFDPDVVQACFAFQHEIEFWNDIGREDFVRAELPWLAVSAIETDVDGICEAFAMIIDAKSSFTSEHSTRVTQYALVLGKYFGFSEARLRTLKRAGLMHDIGKLGVSTGILEKPGKLDQDEFDVIKSHPKLSDLILRRIPTFDAIADIASAHHERLDGKGYWRGIDEDQLSLDVRIMTVSDVFDALTATRPYREGLPLEMVFSIMNKDAGTAFDPGCLDALQECFGAGVPLRQAA